MKGLNYEFDGHVTISPVQHHAPKYVDYEFDGHVIISPVQYHANLHQSMLILWVVQDTN